MELQFLHKNYKVIALLLANQNQLRIKLHDTKQIHGKAINQKPALFIDVVLNSN